jgi:predicted Rdx family selenoprotein
VFDVIADGRLVFSKHRDGRFPDAAEIVRVLK